MRSLIVLALVVAALAVAPPAASQCPKDPSDCQFFGGGGIIRVNGVLVAAAVAHEGGTSTVDSETAVAPGEALEFVVALSDGRVNATDNASVTLALRVGDRVAGVEWSGEASRTVTFRPDEAQPRLERFAFTVSTCPPEGEIEVPVTVAGPSETGTTSDTFRAASGPAFPCNPWLFAGGAALSLVAIAAIAHVGMWRRR